MWTFKGVSASHRDAEPACEEEVDTSVRGDTLGQPGIEPDAYSPNGRHKRHKGRLPAV